MLYVGWDGWMDVMVIIGHRSFKSTFGPNNFHNFQCIFVNVCKNSACYPGNHWIFQFLAESSHVAKNNSIQKPLLEEGKMGRFVFLLRLSASRQFFSTENCSGTFFVQLLSYFAIFVHSKHIHWHLFQ